MKITRCFLIMAVVVAAGQPLQAQVASPDTMVQKVFATLRAKDQQAFVALYPNGAQFGRFIRDIMEKTFKSEEMQQMMKLDERAKNLNVDSLINAQVATASSPEAIAEMQKQFGEIFQRIIEKGEKKGVNWSDATITGYTIDSAEAAGNPSQPVNVKSVKGVIDFTSGGNPYQLSFDKMLYMPAENSWFGADFPQLARKGESLTPDAPPASQEVDEAPAAAQKQAPATRKAPAKKSAAKAPVKKKATS